MADSRDRDRILSEYVLSELKTIHEFVSDIPQIKEDVAQLKEDMTEVKADVAIIKDVVSDHETRITALENHSN